MARAKAGKLSKQSYEEFRIDVDFGLNMEVNEVLVLVESEVKVWDVEGTETTVLMTDSATKMLITGFESTVIEGGLQILIKGGTEDFSPYKITFYGVTNLVPSNKWEQDIVMTIKELPTS